MNSRRRAKARASKPRRSLRGIVCFFGGAAGAGKSTVAALWCASQPRPVHLQLDDVRDLIVSGRSDPQVPCAEQTHQYVLSVRACCAIARVFAQAGYSVAIDDVLEPPPFRNLWLPGLTGLDWRIVILHPSLPTVIERGAARPKRVAEHHVRAQHAACALWPRTHRIDTTGLTPEQSYARAASALVKRPPRIPKC